MFADATRYHVAETTSLARKPDQLPSVACLWAERSVSVFSHPHHQAEHKTRMALFSDKQADRLPHLCLTACHHQALARCHRSHQQPQSGV